MWEGVIIRPGIFKLIGVILLEGGRVFEFNISYILLI